MFNTFTTFTTAAIDLAAVAFLVFAVYYPRHRRSDLVVAFLGVNVGVLAVSAVLATTDVGAGLGMGLFGVLSIIRLRSSEISQREVAYYFAVLAIGLICGISNSPLTAAAASALIVGVLAAADGMSKATHQEEIVVDRALADRDELQARVEELTGATVLGLEVLRLDTVNDTTLVAAQLRREAPINLPVGV
ncbi:hypothetical protein CGLAUT_02570 [Corynebacterium glaucum]|uniref:DUF4956 domain-containing protein n=1 Tax=Corynebacterium glaucum TaxID=187491 RepID=UPI0025B5CD6B|nr:DUF4956 domain-containing protein [Corynebacterium glaucum]WJZ07020.1 hypothetical protein CGLAUT_02570 [Corynebacterium glaucum]